VSVLAGGGVQRLWERWGTGAVQFAMPAAVAIVIVMLGLLSFRQAQHWQDSETLWNYVLDNGTPTVEYMDGYINLEQALLQAGKYDDAEGVFKRAIAIDSTGADPYFNMGYVCYYRGQTDSAMYLFRKTVRLDSTYAEAYYNIGILNIAMKNETAAVDSLRKAAQLGYREAQQILAKNGIKW
jgi:Flp pilus assembly protein TadD